MKNKKTNITDQRVLQDSGRVVGRVSVRLYDVNDKLIDVRNSNNLVVTLGRQACAERIGSAVSNKYITDMQFGTSSTPTSLSDTSITSPFIKPIQAVSYPLPNAVRFVSVLASSEYNGNTIEEVGLFLNNGDMFARYLTGAIEKTSAIRVEITWDIIF